MIAELDGAYTNYYEATIESEWRGSKSFVRGSYTCSRYYGNLDQDNSATSNDDNIFIGSSNIGDGAGRQLWNFKDGTSAATARNLLKLYGYRTLPWNASAGAFAIAQSGQPWEMWSYEPYIALTTSTSDTARYAERAGSRRTPAHWQLDLNYTQNIRMGPRLNLQFAGDLFNVFNKQTGYDFEPSVHNSAFGTPRSYLRATPIPARRTAAVLSTCYVQRPTCTPSGVHSVLTCYVPTCLFAGIAARTRSADRSSRRRAAGRRRCATPGQVRRAGR